ncbi:MAG: carbamoyl-phosphate synthase small subunit, partial [Treponema sp.]|nr:carbamoyl-phosphate synthase small subunit [Treponema sp.]MDY5757002.1 carbamoyl-phosphate synthase small subunit [Treponema sp.]
NYGDIPVDYESKKSWVRGYIVRELCEQPSNFRCSGQLNNFLKAQGIIGICGIDTRALTKRLREAGVMNGMIVSVKNTEKLHPQELLAKIKDYKIEGAVERVQNNSFDNCHAELNSASNGHAELVSASINKIPKQVRNDKIIHHIVLFDFGAKLNIQRELEKRGCKVTVVPYNTTAEEVLKMAPDGIMLSNGPGDPAENVEVIEEIRKLCEWNKKCVIPRLDRGISTSQTVLDCRVKPDNDTKYKSIPIFGICLGHQMLALARGCKTSKLKYGHRGVNHPCKDTETGRVYITSQNHGYAVENTSLPPYAKMSFFNVNDGTVEGITYTDIPAFSVQFHPEACGGPHDTNFLFDRFLKMIIDSETCSE